jgi:hypothetical protein
MTEPRYDGLPRHRVALETRLRNIANARGANELRLRRTLANTIVAQMLPPGVVKGGTALKLRVGEAGSRFTPDFDAARAENLTVDDFIDDFGRRLATGWNGFTGRIVRLDPADPPGIPDDYVMQPFELKLSYRNQAWLTVEFELGHDEIGSTKNPTFALARELIELFDQLGLPAPAAVALLSTEHQIAQKLHACTTPNRHGGNERAHDIVDLQILIDADPPDYSVLANVGPRLFTARRVAPWPPVVRIFPGWEETYARAAEGLDVRTLPKAVEWINNIIATIEK